MQEIGNMTAFVSFNFLLVLMAFWLLIGMLLYDLINSEEDKINRKKRQTAIHGRGIMGVYLSSVFMTLLSVLNITFLIKNINGDLLWLIIAVALNVLFYIGAVLSFVVYLKLKHNSNKDSIKIRKFNSILVFTTIIILADVIFTFIWSR
ncbi:MAG: hypothetical protein K2L19_03420 [Eubacterium sp.]|nr:hypothetical protein [Eubacterium sp.]